MHTNIIAEIGINHNGDLGVAKKLIDAAVLAGCDYVKFQKRNPMLSVPEHQKNVIKDTPWGKMTYLKYRDKVEFDKHKYDKINWYCRSKGIKWFASVWDEDSVDFMRQYTDMMKIPSPMLTNHTLINSARLASNYLLMSTGMSTEEEIKKAVEVGKPDVLFHCNSAYPSKVNELNLNYINWMQDKYDCEIGYSGHEYGLTTTFAAVAMGVTWVERHITLDRLMWGSDQMASIEPIGLIKLAKGIRDIEKAFTGYGERKLNDSEIKKRESLRG